MPQPDDNLHDLRDRIAETRRAAERLAAEVPIQGWASPGDARAAHDDVAALAGLVSALRELVPAELQGQVNEVLRQVLLLLRAIVDHLVERLEPPAPGTGARPGPPAGADVQDIPVA